MRGYKYVTAKGDALRGKFRYPLVDLPQTFTHKGEVILEHRGFHASPSEVWAVSYATSEARVLLTCELEDIEDSDESKAVGRRITILSAKPDFAHPTQLTRRAAVYLAAKTVELVADLNPDQRVRGAIDAALRYTAGRGSTEECRQAERAAWAAEAVSLAARAAARAAEAAARAAEAAVWAAEDAAAWWAAWAAAERAEEAARGAGRDPEAVWRAYLTLGRKLLARYPATQDPRDQGEPVEGAEAALPRGR